jgi:hypothetical protein
VAHHAVHKLQLCNKFCRESSVAIADEGDVMPETHEFSRLSDRLTTECVSFGDKALDCSRCGKGQALVLIGILSIDLSISFVCRVAHESPGCLLLSASRDFYTFQ